MEDFVRLDEYEMGFGADVNKIIDDKSTTQNSSEGFLTRSFKSNEDILPLAATAAPFGQPLGGIMVQTEYSVDSASQNSKIRGKKEPTDERRYRL
jgi:hypothetical protein